MKNYAGCICTMFLVSIIALVVIQVADAQTATRGLNPLTSVFQKKRSDKEDIIYLRNNDVLSGQVLNETFTITTPYGDVEVSLRRCAGLSFEGSRANTESLVTVNYNRITGIMKDRKVNFKIGSSGIEVPIRKEKIRFILLKRKPDETDFVDAKGKVDLFVMANGDLLTGEPGDPKIEIQTDYGEIPVSFSEMSTLEMQGGDKVAAVIKKKNGDTMRGMLLTEEITLKLDVGSEVEGVYKDKFSSIYVDEGIKQVSAKFGVMQPIKGESEGALLEHEGKVGEETITNSIGMKLKLIKAGEFMMGSEKGDDDEKPVHKVRITKPFYIGVYEVTQAQYEKIMGENPSHFKGPNRPVERVAWNNAVLFCKKLSEKEGVKYRLPTEAEWEYACRAGTTTKYYWGDVMDGKYAWYRHENSEEKTHDVGQKKPNAWGLYDMSGNVYELCSDHYSGDYYGSSPSSNPRGPASGSRRVLRGGSWKTSSNGVRSALRGNLSPDFVLSLAGFRVVRAPE